MLLLILFLLAVAAVAAGLAWLADRPGELVINWQGYHVETSVFLAVVAAAVTLALAVMLYAIARQLWRSPATVGDFLNRRRQKKGLESLSAGMIAVGAGDRSLATRYAVQARKSLPNEPMTHLLRAQAAQLSGDKATARRIFEAMLGSPDTEQLGLRGLFLEAQRESEPEAARQFADRALRLNPKLSWPVEALFDLQCRAADWAGALETLATARKHHQMEKPVVERRRAILLTAQAQDTEDTDPERALNLALEAHGLAPDLVPAAAIAGRMLASRGNTPRATKVIQKTWQRSPHPDLAEAYAFARLGDSPRDRLERVKQLAALYPTSIESSIAVAKAAIEAKDYEYARMTLEELRDGRLTNRACLLMARVEGEQYGDKGRVREWLARAVNAARDPVWTADGVVSEHWAPISPVTGQLDAFQWRVPVETMDKTEGELFARKLDELVALGAGDETARAPLVTAEAAPVAAEVKVERAAPPVATEKPAAPEPRPVAKPNAPAATTPAPAASSAATSPPAAAQSSVPPHERAAMPEMAVAPPRTVKAGEATAASTGTGRAPVEVEPPAPPKAAEPAARPSPKTLPASAPRPSAPASRPQTAAKPPLAEQSAPRPTVSAASPSPAPSRPPQTEQPVPKAAPSTGDGAPAQPAPAAAKQATAERPARQEARPAEPRIFVAPRAPDDPGTEPAEAEEVKTPLRGLYRITS